MSGLGNVILGKLDLSGTTFSFDESVCGMLFDFGLYEDPFYDFEKLESYFGGNQVQLIHNLQEAEDMGLTDGFMNGIPYYHINQYYEYIGSDAELYVMFADCTDGDEPDFEAIQLMQQLAGGKVFQLGIWTEQCIWESGGENYNFTSLLGEIEAHAEVLAGKVGKTWTDGLPLSIILNACTSKLADRSKCAIDHWRLPDATKLGFSKISVILGQNGDEDVHTMQKTNHNCTPVGFLGVAMACLHLASAEMNIGFVDRFDINKNDNLAYPELGFGDIDADSYTPIEELNSVRGNAISLNGYILPTTYKSKESGVYFSNDQTLSERDFSTISLNRIAHKCRRIIRSVMFPRINANIDIDPSTGTITAIEQTKLINLITEQLDANMVNQLGQAQISERYISFDDTKNILETDELDVSCYIVPVSSNMTIEVQEGYIMSDTAADTPGAIRIQTVSPAYIPKSVDRDYYYPDDSEEEEGGGISEQVQADWEQTDSTAVDYIRHKPTIPDTSTLVPSSRKVNGKALTGDITLDASDVGALPADTPIPASVTEQTVAGWGFTKNTGTYSKPAAGIPASDLEEGVIPDISGKEDKVAIATALPATLEVGKYYRLGTVGTLSAALPTVSDTSHAASIMIGLTASADITPALTSSASVYYQEGFEIKSGGVYEINCLYNGSYWSITNVKFEAV